MKKEIWIILLLAVLGIILFILILGLLADNGSLNAKISEWESWGETIEKENTSLEKENESLNKELEEKRKNWIPKEEAAKIGAQYVVEKIKERDNLWEQAILDTFAHRKKPADVVRAEVDTWNNTEISKQTGFKLEITD